jgi:hypothetical protein
MLAVTVNDRPLNVSAVVEHGRVLLPMRATFSALGATISYDPGGNTIVARTPAHMLRLRIGADTASVDGHSVRLDVPAHTIAARTYVPLRFVAQAMGAVVGYDAPAQLVTVTSVQPHSASPVSALNPAPDAAVASAYPTISATLDGVTATQGEVSLSVDGVDVSSLATFDGSTITYMPRAGMARGTHSVVFSGHTIGGEPFSAQWSFATSLAAPPDASAFRPEEFRFYASGPATYYAGDWMHFVLIAPPNGHAELQLCNLGSFQLLGNSGGMMYTTSIPAPAGVWIPACQVTAVYTSWNGTRSYVPVPVYIGLYTRPNPARTPKPHSTQRPLPPEPRKPPQTPAPVAAPPTPRPAAPPPATPPPATPHPITTAPPAHRPLPVPRPRRTPIPR